MPFVNGQYSAPASSWNPAIPGNTIESAAYNSQLSDIETALSTCVLKDGTQTITANIPMSGFKFTGVNTNSGNTSQSEFVSGATLQDGAPLDAGYTAGSSTVYTATLTPAITAYADKQCFRVIFDEATGATPTINFNSVGAKKIYQSIGGSAVQITTNDIPANYPAILRYDATLDTAAGAFWLMNPPALNINNLTETTTVDNFLDFIPVYDASASANRKVRPEYLLGLLQGFLYGLTITNNGSDSNNDVDVAAGQAVDNTNFALMVLASSITKRLDANWAVGTNQGGLDTGSKANSTTYFIWLIQRSDTGVVDVLFSTSNSAPTMPANYDRKRLIGAVRTDGSGNIISGQITQHLAGGRVQFTAAAQTITSAGALTLPHGIGAIPTSFQGFLVAQNSVSGYTAGDIVLINAMTNTAGGGANQGVSVVPDATNLNVRYGSAGNVFLVIEKNTGNTQSQTNTDWKFFIRCWI